MAFLARSKAVTSAASLSCRLCGYSRRHFSRSQVWSSKPNKWQSLQSAHAEKLSSPSSKGDEWDFLAELDREENEEKQAKPTFGNSRQPDDEDTDWAFDASSEEDFFADRSDDTHRTGFLGKSPTSPRATTTEKERQILTRILDSILDSSSRTSKNRPSATSNIQALFESSSSSSEVAGSAGTDSSIAGAAPSPASAASSFSAKPNVFSPARPNVKLDITTDDVRRLPLSYGSLIRQERSNPSDPLELHGLKDKVKKCVDPILSYIYNEIPTDQQVLEYFRKKIFERHDPSSILVSMSEQEYEANSPYTDVELPLLSKETIPLYLERAMAALYQVFEEPAAAVSLFEQCKRYSIDFYASACSVDAYNHMLRIRWHYFKDLYAVQALTSEMTVNAVHGNSETAEILGNLSREFLDIKHGIGGLNGMPLWSSEDKARVESLSRYRLKIVSRLANLEGFPV